MTAPFFQHGANRIYLIHESQTMMDAGGVFGLVPRPLYSSYITPNADNLLPMAHHCLLVQTPTQNILIDTGNGDKLNARQRQIVRLESNGGIPAALARIGITPEQIDLVIVTHLHADHVGGATHLDANGVIVPTFPNAEYVVQRREHADAIRPNERTRATYFSDNFQPLIDNGQMRLLDGDIELAPGVRGVVTPGHTPGHMSVILDGDPPILFVCDLASYAIHFARLGWMTAYDVEPLVTLENKRIWQAWALEHNPIIVFVHDSLTPVGRFIDKQVVKDESWVYA